VLVSKCCEFLLTDLLELCLGLSELHSNCKWKDALRIYVYIYIYIYVYIYTHFNLSLSQTHTQCIYTQTDKQTDRQTDTNHLTCCSGCSGSVASMVYSWVGWLLHTLPWLSTSPCRTSSENRIVSTSQRI